MLDDESLNIPLPNEPLECSKPTLSNRQEDVGSSSGETSEVAQSYPTLCDPKDCNPPGFSVHGIFQARVLEWVAISSPGDLPNPGIEPRSPALWADAPLPELPGKPMIQN